MLPVRVLCVAGTVWLFAAVAAANSVGLDGLTAEPAVFADGVVDPATPLFSPPPPVEPSLAAADESPNRVAFVGDANGDGRVDFSDLVLLAQHYGTTSGATWSDGDFNADGGVGFDDLVGLAQHYGLSAAPAETTADGAAVPVPSTGWSGLVLFAGLAAWKKMTRR